MARPFKYKSKPLTHKGSFGRYFGDREDYVADGIDDGDASGDAVARKNAATEALAASTGEAGLAEGEKWKKKVREG